MWHRFPSASDAQATGRRPTRRCRSKQWFVLRILEWGRNHGDRNLFIVDGSIVVTSAGVKPISTIQALALNVADNINQRLANLFD